MVNIMLTAIVVVLGIQKEPTFSCETRVLVSRLAEGSSWYGLNSGAPDGQLYVISGDGKMIAIEEGILSGASKLPSKYEYTDSGTSFEATYQMGFSGKDWLFGTPESVSRRVDENIARGSKFARNVICTWALVSVGTNQYAYLARPHVGAKNRGQRNPKLAFFLLSPENRGSTARPVWLEDSSNTPWSIGLIVDHVVSAFDSTSFLVGGRSKADYELVVLYAKNKVTSVFRGERPEHVNLGFFDGNPKKPYVVLQRRNEIELLSLSPTYKVVKRTKREIPGSYGEVFNASPYREWLLIGKQDQRTRYGFNPDNLKGSGLLVCDPKTFQVQGEIRGWQVIGSSYHNRHVILGKVPGLDARLVSGPLTFPK